MLLRWTSAAADDLTQISDHSIKRFGIATARRTALTIYNAADALKLMPYRGRRGRKPDTRELPLPGLPFVIVFKVREEAIEIIRILHGAQPWP